MVKVLWKMNVTQTAIHYLIWETVKNPPYLISCILNCSLVGFNIWGIAVNSTKGNEFFQQVLDAKSKVTLEDAIFCQQICKIIYSFGKKKSWNIILHKIIYWDGLKELRLRNFWNIIPLQSFKGLNWTLIILTHSPFLTMSYGQHSERWSSMGILQECEKLRHIESHLSQ